MTLFWIIAILSVVLYAAGHYGLKFAREDQRSPYFGNGIVEWIHAVYVAVPCLAVLGVFAFYLEMALRQSPGALL